MNASFHAWKQTNRDHTSSAATHHQDQDAVVIKDLEHTLQEFFSTECACRCPTVRLSLGLTNVGLNVQWKPSDNSEAAAIDVPELRLTDCLSWTRASSNLSTSTKKDAIEIVIALKDAYYQTIASAVEVEDMSIEEGMDALVYMIGTLYFLNDLLHVQSHSVSSLPCGEGVTLETLYLCTGMQISTNKIGTVTPLAAAMIKVLSSSEGRNIGKGPASFQLCGIGVASLLPDVEDSMQSTIHPSSVRLLVGTTTRTGEETRMDTQSEADTQPASETTLLSPWKMDCLIHMEANLDDITAEALAFAVEVLLQQGAVDAWVTPIIMKKGRAAHTLHCLCHQSAKDGEDSTKNAEIWEKLLRLIFQHTTTLGVRINSGLQRAALHRSFVTVQTPFDDNKRNGRVSVKLGYYFNHDSNIKQVVSVKAEFDHCREISLETGVPIQQIAACAVQEACKTSTQQD